MMKSCAEDMPNMEDGLYNNPLSAISITKKIVYKYIFKG